MADRPKYKHEWYLKNRERLVEKQRKYNQENPNYPKEYYQKNKEKRLKYSKKRYNAIKKQYLEYWRS